MQFKHSGICAPHRNVSIVQNPGNHLYLWCKHCKYTGVNLYRVCISICTSKLHLRLQTKIAGLLSKLQVKRKQFAVIALYILERQTIYIYAQRIIYNSSTNQVTVGTLDVKLCRAIDILQLFWCQR